MAVIRNIHETAVSAVEMDGVKGASMAVMVGREHGAPHFSMRSFVLDAGGHTPRHAHDYEHEVYVVSGRGEVLLGGAWHALKEGDTVLVDADKEHQFRVGEGEGAPMRFLCMVPVEQNCGGAVPGS